MILCARDRRHRPRSGTDEGWLDCCDGDQPLTWDILHSDCPLSLVPLRPRKRKSAAMQSSATISLPLVRFILYLPPIFKHRESRLTSLCNYLLLLFIIIWRVPHLVILPPLAADYTDCCTFAEAAQAQDTSPSALAAVPGTPDPVPALQGVCRECSPGSVRVAGPFPQ